MPNDTVGILHTCARHAHACDHYIWTLNGNQQTVDELKAASGVSADAFTHFLVFAAGVFGNMGNFLSFGDTKIMPECDATAFRRILEASAAWKHDASSTMPL